MAAATARPGKPLIDLRRIDIDGVFAFALFLTMLFIVQLGTLGAALLCLLAVGYAYLVRDRWFEIAAPRAVILVIPLFVLLSTVWSEAPKTTFKYGAELALTAGVGLMLSTARRQTTVMRAIFLAFAIYVAGAVMFGQSVAMGAAGERAFSGLTAGKNLLAEIASTGFLLSLGVLALSLRERRTGWWMAALGVAAVTLYACVAARSAGALLGLGVAVGAFLGLLVVRAAPMLVRGVLVMLLAFGMVAVAMSYRALSTGLIEAAATYFNKDPTLTGRSYLWHRAYDLIAEKPLLGRGYHAFWVQGNVDAEGLWRYAGIGGRGGFNFHNTAVEVLVHFGWVGLVVMGAAAAVGLIALMRRLVVRPSLSLCFWMAILVYGVVRMPIESIGFVPFHYFTALLYAGFGAAFAPQAALVARPLARRARRAPPPSRVVRSMRPVGRRPAPQA